MKLYIQIIVACSSYAFILATLFAAGLGLTVKEIIEPLKKIKLTVLALMVNFVFIPALAYTLSALFKLDASLQAGLVIIACCAGAPFLPRLIIKAKGNVAHTVGIMVLLIVVTVFYAPAVLPLLIPGISIDPVNIAGLLFVLMLLPLALGLMVKAWRPNLAGSVRRYTDVIASLSLLLVVVFGLLVDYKLLVSAYGTGIYIFAGLFTLCTVLIGFLFGGDNNADKITMTFASGARNVPAALLIAITSFSDSRIISVILICSLLQFIVLQIIANACRKAAR